VPKIAAEIARRLLAAGRIDEAWCVIEAAEHKRGSWPDFEWEDARILKPWARGRGTGCPLVLFRTIPLRAASA
jgi:hypothetical protein